MDEQETVETAYLIKGFSFKFINHNRETFFFIKKTRLGFVVELQYKPILHRD